jgi:type II secretory pathway predicted ATPase ExeA
MPDHLSVHDVYENFQKYPFSLQDFDYPMVGRDAEWDKIVQRVEQSLQKTGNEIIVIRGDYGMGKSFTLTKLYDQFSKRSEYFVPHKMLLLSAEQTSKFSVALANRLFENIGLQKVAHLTQRAKESWRGRISPRADEIFTALLSGDKEVAAQAFNMLANPKLQPRDGQALIFGLQFILAQNKKRALLWLIDEFEYVLVLSKSKLSQLAQTLRELYDRQADFEKDYGTGESAKIIFVYATSPAGWERLALTAEGAGKRAGLTGTAGVGVAPFHRRVPQANIIDLDPLTKANTLKLIEMRMKTRKSPLKPPYIPFTDDFIDYIYQMTKGRPSEIIMLCDMIFLEAHDKKLLEVDRKSAKEILLKLGLRAEPE